MFTPKRKHDLLLEYAYICTCTCICVNERYKGRKAEARSYKQQGKATQHTQGGGHFPKKNELPRVGLEPTTLYTLDRVLSQLSYRGCSAGWLGPNLTSHSPDEQAYYQMYMYIVHYTCTCILFHIHVHACTCTCATVHVTLN